MNFIAENWVELAVGYLVLLSAIMCLFAINDPDDDKISSADSSRQGEELEGNPRPWTGTAAQPGQPATDEDI